MSILLLKRKEAGYKLSYRYFCYFPTLPDTYLEEAVPVMFFFK
jgi:hypothetical protein